MSPASREPPLWQGWKIILCSAGRRPDPTSHEVIPLSDLKHCTSSQLCTQLNHPLVEGLANSPLSGTAQPDSLPVQAQHALVPLASAGHQCCRPPNPADLEQQELSPKLCCLLAQPWATARSLSCLHSGQRHHRLPHQPHQRLS